MGISFKRRRTLILATTFLVVAAATPIVIAYRVFTNNGKLFEDYDNGKLKHKYKVRTSLINVGDSHTTIKIENLNNHIGQTLTLNYRELDLDLATNKTKDSKVWKKIKFAVNSKVEVIDIGNLKPSTNYEYKVVDEIDQQISDVYKFVTYAKVKFEIASETHAISLASQPLGAEYANKQFVISYQEFDNDPNNQKVIQEIELKTETKQIADKTVYVLVGQIANLKDSTPYNLTLHIKEQETTIGKPIITWTKGNETKVIVSDVSQNEAKFEVSGLTSSAVNTSGTNSVVLKYYKTTEPNNVKEIPLESNGDDLVQNKLSNLEFDSHYVLSLAETNNNQEVVLTQKIEFWTRPQPYIEHEFQKSTTNGLLILSGLTSKLENAKAYSPNNIQIVATEVTTQQAQPDFNNGLKFNINSSDEDKHTIKLNDLNSGKIYAIQAFEKSDVTFANPLLAQNYIIQMPEQFTSEVLNIAEHSATIKIANINNYKSGEVALVYWNKANDQFKQQHLLTFDENTDQLEVKLNQLTSFANYQYSIYPINQNLRSTTDNLLNSNVEFKTKGIPAAFKVEGNRYTEYLKFKLSQIDSDFPINQPLILQWRLKTPIYRSAFWFSPRVNDSFEFIISELPKDGTFEIQVPISDELYKWVNTHIYEWRIVEKSNLRNNLIKAGNTEFQFTVADTLEYKK